MPARILPRDQHGQLERIAKTDLRELLRSRLGSEQVPALKCLLEDPVRTALREVDAPPPRGRDGVASLELRLEQA